MQPSGALLAMLTEPAAKRIAKLVRLMSSEHDGEWSNAVRKLKIVLGGEGLTFNDLAAVIESANGEIEERRYSETDAKAIFERGVEKGKAQGNGSTSNFSGQYIDEFGQPHWTEIAMFCRGNPAFARLKPNEQDLVNEMPTRVARWGAPTRPSGGFLLSIFWKLGGSFK